MSIEKRKKKKEEESVEEAEPDMEAEMMEQQLLYILKSVEVAACRLAEGLTELAYDLQSNTVAALSLPKTLRTKFKPEVVCLRDVIARFFHGCEQFPVNADNTSKDVWASHSHHRHSSVGTPQHLSTSNSLKRSCQSTVTKPPEFDFSFIHHLLALKAARQAQKNLVAGDICLLAETLKVFVSHLSFVHLDSSDEEGDRDVGLSEVIREKKENAQHFSCVLKCLEQALNAMQGKGNAGSNPGLTFKSQSKSNAEADVDINQMAQHRNSSESDKDQNKTVESNSSAVSDEDSKTTSEKSDLILNRNNLTYQMQFVECNCCWRKTQISDDSNQENGNHTPRTKYTKAFNFLHQTLFSEPKNSVGGGNNNRYNVLDVVKKLSYEDEDCPGILTPGKLKVGENVIVKGRLNVGNCVSISVKVLENSEGDGEHEKKSEMCQDEVDSAKKRSVNASKNEVVCDSEKVGAVDHEEETVSEGENDDSDSFATAASSVEDDMATPEEGVKIYING